MSHTAAKIGEGWHNDGTAQNERFPPALDPSAFQIDDRSIGEHLHAIALMARQLRFNESASWRALLPEVSGLAGGASAADEKDSISDWEAFAEHAARHRKNPPHLALLITFLRLFRHHQARVNLLTKGHLDHYYRQVLGFSQSPAQPDHICVFPSLMPKVIERWLPAGTSLTAGVDREGNALVYTLDNEIVVTRAKVAAVKSISYLPLVVTPPAEPRMQTWLRTAPFVEGKPHPWRPFATVPASSSETAAPASAAGTQPDAALEEKFGLGIGVAISSPLLFLQEGERVITLEFNQAPGLPFHCCLSTPEGWFFLPDRIESADTVVITVPATAPPLAAVNPKVHLDALPTHCPAIKLYVGASASQEAYAACVDKVSLMNLQVTVRGVKGLKLANEAGPVDPSQPFMPFGAHPVAGANFRFAADEMKAKPVTHCVVNFDWLDRGTHRIQINQLPEKPSAGQPDTKDGLHLFDKAPADEDDTVRLTQVQDGFTLTLAGMADPFGHASYPRRVSAWALENAVRVAHEMASAYHADGIAPAGSKAVPAPAPPHADKVPAKDLPASATPPTPAPPEVPPVPHGFGLAAWAKKALGLVREAATEHHAEPGVTAASAPAEPAPAPPLPDDPRYPPPPPYTPTLKSFTLDYSARQDSVSSPGSACTFYHLHPFGIASGSASGTLLPRQSAKVLASALFIGIADFNPAQPLNLHFAVIEGSGSSLPAGGTAPTVSWHFLGEDGWADLITVAEQQSTLGLLQPGIIAFRVDMNIAVDAACKLASLYWLRATVVDPDRVIGDLCGITAQAVTATLRLGATAPVHLRGDSWDSLPAGSVKGLLLVDPAIAGITQPQPSYGGRPAEDERGFYTRVAERLRHRNRAITPADYELLVLHAFPEIYKAICVRAGPGEIIIVVVPSSAGAHWLDLFQPRTRPVLLQRIQDYLCARSSGLVHIRVVDPNYEKLQVSCSVLFKPGQSPDLLKTVLNEDLKRYLTPWAADNPEEAAFTCNLHHSVINAFIANRDYVQQVTKFELTQFSEAHPDGIRVTEAEATSATSVLVSAPNHLITLPVSVPSEPAFPNPVNPVQRNSAYAPLHIP